MTSTRPDPGREAAPGFHFEAVEQHDWVTPAPSEKGCRFTVGPEHQVCGAPPVAALYRTYAGRGKKPWNYCGEHLYGRWIEDGKVMGWRMVHACSPAPKSYDRLRARTRRRSCLAAALAAHRSRGLRALQGVDVTD